MTTCSGCGSAVPGNPPLTWSSAGPRGAIWLCERCTRENVRAIEAKLDEEHW